jgi:predicted transcriptional regulator
MKNTILAVIFFFLWCAVPLCAAELKVGDKAPSFSLTDSFGKVYTLNSDDFKGRVVSVLYSAPSKKNLNSHVENALLKDEGLDRENNYKGFSIANLKASMYPNFIIRDMLKNKKEKTGALILLDYDYTIINLWGLKNKSSDIVVLDKDGICRYIYKGKLPPEEVTKLIDVIKQYQVK